MLSLHVRGDQAVLGDNVHEVGGPSDGGDWRHKSERVRTLAGFVSGFGRVTGLKGKNKMK